VLGCWRVQQLDEDRASHPQAGEGAGERGAAARWMGGVWAPAALAMAAWARGVMPQVDCTPVCYSCRLWEAISHAIHDTLGCSDSNFLSQASFAAAAAAHLWDDGQLWPAFMQLVGLHQGKQHDRRLYTCWDAAGNHCSMHAPPVVGMGMQFQSTPSACTTRMLRPRAPLAVCQHVNTHAPAESAQQCQHGQLPCTARSSAVSTCWKPVLHAWAVA
jgi:hypothetical protein